MSEIPDSGALSAITTRKNITTGAWTYDPTAAQTVTYPPCQRGLAERSQCGLVQKLEELR